VTMVCSCIVVAFSVRCILGGFSVGGCSEGGCSEGGCSVGCSVGCSAGCSVGCSVGGCDVIFIAVILVIAPFVGNTKRSQTCANKKCCCHG
jgi:hypothetical protein